MVLDPKMPAVVIGSLLWKPFDVRFNEFLESLDAHCAAFKQEFKLMVTHMHLFAKKEAAEERTQSQNERDEATSARAVLRETHDATAEVKELLINQQRGKIKLSMFSSPKIYLSRGFGLCTTDW
jgi:hypothetical protein